jgi:A/G-specific adenine glycosylase
VSGGSPSTKLLAWYDREKRFLPWRGTRDPYRVWVSEVMLQQTTVQAVAPRYDAFLERFPDMASLARAREASVLAAWSGLGYYARARNLHRAAREILRRHGGRLPRDPEELRALPGFGAYTAAAVASLAFGRSVPAAEANVTRVLSRVYAIPGVAGTPAHRREVERRAARWQRGGRPGDLTAALMDLGQLICRPRRPACPDCPIVASCAARRSGFPERYPRRRAKPAAVRVHVAAALALSRGRALLIQKPELLLRSLWQFPSAEGPSHASALSALRRELARLGLRRMSFARPRVTQHTIVNRNLQISVYLAEPADNRKSKVQDPKSDVRWITPRQLRHAAIPTLTRKIAIASGFLGGGNRRILIRDESRTPPDASGSQRRRTGDPGDHPNERRNRLPAPDAASPQQRPLRVHGERRSGLLAGRGRGR